MTLHTKNGTKVTWENVAVVIISDGLSKASKSALEYASRIGIYDEELLKKHKSDQTRMHLFEFTPQLQSEVPNKYCLPLQTVYAIKQQNGGKLDSHFWFFNAFAEQIMPEFTFLIDVGTKPGPYSIVRLFAAMNANPHIGGCCGEITVANPKYTSAVQAAQHFEYKTSNFMGKCMESLFGYIAVLPGAFSAYRYEAIRGQPLQRYFYSLSRALSPFKANMYLAEDRILCLELLAKQGCSWVLHYVKDAPAVTDVPESLAALIKQRRRWLNGSFFAQIYSLLHFNRIWTESNHTFVRKLFLSIEFMYFFVASIFTWFTVGNFFIAFRFIAAQVMTSTFLWNPNSVLSINGVLVTTIIYEVLQICLMLLLVILLIISLCNKPEDMGGWYKLASIVFGTLGYLMIAAVLIGVASSNYISFEGKIATLATLAAPVICAIVHLELPAVLSCLLQYYFMMPTYVIIFSIFR